MSPSDSLHVGVRPAGAAIYLTDSGAERRSNGRPKEFFAVARTGGLRLLGTSLLFLTLGAEQDDQRPARATHAGYRVGVGASACEFRSAS